MLKRALGAVLFWLACYLLASCAHRYQSHQTATRTEETRTTWQTAETAVRSEQSTETKNERRRRVREKFRPDGTLLERLTEQVESDGRVQVVTSEHGSRSAARADFSSVRASSSSTKASSTETRLPWFRIGAGVAIVALLCYLVYRWRRRRSLLGL